MMDDVQEVSASHWFGHDTGMGGKDVWLVCGVMSGRKRWSGCDASDDGMGTGTSVVGGHELAAAAGSGLAVWRNGLRGGQCG